MTGFASTYALLRDRLRAEINQAVWPSPEAGFLDYLQATTNDRSPQRALVTGRLDETPMLAAAGYQYVTAIPTRLPVRPRMGAPLQTPRTAASISH